jgi:hypothetical protein
LAVIALCGTVVFGASLSHLTVTPELYGDAYQLTFPVIPGLPEPMLFKTLDRDGNIKAIAQAVAVQVSIAQFDRGGRRGRSTPWSSPPGDDQRAPPQWRWPDRLRCGNHASGPCPRGFADQRHRVRAIRRQTN